MVSGAENLPGPDAGPRPLLLVGNHARIGLYDLPFLLNELYLLGIKVVNSIL